MNEDSQGRTKNNYIKTQERSKPGEFKICKVSYYNYYDYVWIWYYVLYIISKIYLSIYKSTKARVSEAAMKRPRLVMKTQLISKVTKPTWHISTAWVHSHYVETCQESRKTISKKENMGEPMAPQDQSFPILSLPLGNLNLLATATFFSSSCLKTSPLYT